MKNDDFLETIEKHRQEIYLEDGQDRTIKSRKDLHRSGRKSKSKSNKPSRKTNILLSTLLYMFILIPISFIVYFLVFFDPTADDKAVLSDDFKIETNRPSDNQSAVSAEENDEESSSESKIRILQKRMIKKIQM